MSNTKERLDNIEAAIGTAMIPGQWYTAPYEFPLASMPKQRERINKLAETQWRQSADVTQLQRNSSRTRSEVAALHCRIDRLDAEVNAPLDTWEITQLDNGRWQWTLDHPIDARTWQGSKKTYKKAAKDLTLAILQLDQGIPHDPPAGVISSDNK